MRSRGTQRERVVVARLREAGWVAFRAPASLGCADVVALHRASRPMLLEVESTAGGPFERFDPAERSRLLEAACQAGADALLAYWPPRGSLRLIGEQHWPGATVRFEKAHRG